MNFRLTSSKWLQWPKQEYDYSGYVFFMAYQIYFFKYYQNGTRVSHD